MGVRRIPYSELPYWPRLMAPALAVAHFGVSEAGLEALKIRNMKIGCHPRYDIRDLLARVPRGRAEQGVACAVRNGS